MTKDEQAILQRLRDGEEPIWQAFGDRVQPRIEKALHYAGLSEETAQNVTSEIMVTFCAAIIRLPADLNELAAPPPPPSKS